MPALPIKKIEQDMMQATDKFNGFKEYFKS